VTRERTDRALGATLETWMGAVVPAALPGHVLEEAFARTSASPQSRSYPWRRIVLRGRWSHQPMRTALLAASALLLVAVFIGLMGGGSGPGPGPSSTRTVIASASPGGSTVPVAPSQGALRPDASVVVPQPLRLATDGQLIWVLTASGQVVRIDPATDRASTGVQLGAPTDQVQGIAADSNAVWATEWVTGLLYRVDPNSLKVVARIAAGIAPKGVIATGTDVWVADTHGGIVERIDLETNKIGAAITVAPAAPSGPNWLMSGLGSIWVGVPNSASVVRIDPVTNAIQSTIAVPRSASPCGGIASAGGAVWITSCDASTNVARLDPSANTVAALVHLPGNAYAPAVIDGALWVSVATNPGMPGVIDRIAPATNTVDGEWSPGGDFGGGGDIVVASGSVWVIDLGHDRVLRFPVSAFPPG
jgi:hypothetical protein